MWGGGEVAHGDGDLLDDVLVHGVDVVFELGGGDDGGGGERMSAWRASTQPRCFRTLFVSKY